MSDLPPHTEESDGTWVYVLQYPLASTPTDPHGEDVQKLRLPKSIYARDVRESNRKGIGNDIDVMFFLICSMTKVPSEIVDRLDARDFSNVSALIQHRASSIPT